MRFVVQGAFFLLPYAYQELLLPPLKTFLYDHPEQYRHLFYYFFLQ